MRQDFVHDEVIAELGGTSFMTKQGHVVEGNYRTGDSVLLVFDHSCKRWLPRYKKEQQRSAEVKPVIAKAPEKQRKLCRCSLTIVGPSEVKNGEDTSHTVTIEYDKCSPSQYIGMVPTWEIVPEGKCSGTEIAPPSEWELLWTPNIAHEYPYTGEDFCYVTLVASFEGVGGIPKCHAEKRVKILGCTCGVTIDLAPGSNVGSGDTVTATKDLSLLGCSDARQEENLTVSWDVSVLTCVGTCSVEMISEDADQIVFIPTVEDGDEAYAVFNVHVEVVGADNVPFCEKDELLYVGCWCDVLAIAPTPIAPGLVYQATVKGWYHECTPTEKQMAPLTYWFHDCNGNGPICDVQMSNVQEISEDPPEYQFDFAVNPLAGSGTVILSVQMGGGEEDVPYCRYDQEIVFDCCLKNIGDRYVLMYWEYCPPLFADWCDVPDSPVSPSVLSHFASEIYLKVMPEQDGGCPPFTWTHDGWGELEVSIDTLMATLKIPTEPLECHEKVTVKVKDACGTEDVLEIGSCCEFAALEAGYTSLIMSCGGSQTLTAIGGCGPYTWSLSGGGELSTTEGQETTYTAPATNPNCTDNPTITVTDCCGNTAEIQIAVNCYFGGSAYRYCQTVMCENACPSYFKAEWCAETYNCDGTSLFVSAYHCGGYLPECLVCKPSTMCTCPPSTWDYPCGGTSWGQCPDQGCGTVKDLRSVPMKNAGCCPINPLTGLPF